MDALVALHVLEHIEDDRSAMAEIRRVLTGRGVAILQVLLSSRATDEEPKERGARADHVRLYGADFFDRLSAAGLRWIKVSPRACMADFSVTKYRLAPDDALVFAVRDDFRQAAKSCRRSRRRSIGACEQTAELGDRRLGEPLHMLFRRIGAVLPGDVLQ